MSAPATAGRGSAGPAQDAPAQEAPEPGHGRDWLRELARAAAGPVICAAALIGLLSAWVVTGGTGNIVAQQVQVTQAAVPMRAFTAAGAVRPGRHLPDHLEPGPEGGRAAVGEQPHRAPHRAGPARRAGRPRRPPAGSLTGGQVPAHTPVQVTERWLSGPNMYNA